MIFLKAIVREADPEHFIDIRARIEARMRQEFFLVRDLEAAARYVIDLGTTADTFVGMGVRTRRSGKAEAVRDVRLLWVDADSDEALDRLAAFTPVPSFTVRSGGVTATGRPRRHAYWVLRDRLPADRVKPTLDRLVAALAADTSCTDVARIMRVPGTLNFKTVPPSPVVLEIAR